MNEGDISGFADSVADDIEWWEIGGSEPVRGKAALIETMQFMTDYQVDAQLHDVVANDDHMIALLDVTATKGDESITYRTAEIYHVDTEGKVTQRWAFSDDTQAIAEFFS